MLGGAPTVSVAVAVLPVPAVVSLTVTELFFVPGVNPVTFTENVHVPLAARVPPVRLIVPEPGVAVIVPAPQEPVTPGDVATTTPAGSVSVKFTPLSPAKLFGFVIVKLSVDVPPTPIVDGLNDLLMLGGASTVSVAWALLPVP